MVHYTCKVANSIVALFSSLYGTHSSEGKGNRGKKTSVVAGLFSPVAFSFGAVGSI